MWPQQPLLALQVRLNLLTDITRVAELLDVFPHGRPVVAVHKVMVEAGGSCMCHLPSALMVFSQSFCYQGMRDA